MDFCGSKRDDLFSKTLKQCLTIANTQNMKVSVVFAVIDNVTSAITIIIFIGVSLDQTVYKAETQERDSGTVFLEGLLTGKTCKEVRECE